MANNPMSGPADPTGTVSAEALIGRLRQARTRYRRHLVENFRCFLAPTVIGAAPLLLDICTLWNLDLEKMLMRLRPPEGWPYSPKDRLPPRHPRVNGTGDLGQKVQVVVMQDTLDVRAWIGDAFAFSGGGELQLWLTDRIPETIQTTLPGMPLAAVVDHALLHMRHYEIIRSRPVGNGTVIGARAERLPYTLPWA